MISHADLPDTLPLFPLSGALLLPRGRLPLHVFEPRYLAMVDDALKTPGRMIAMIQPIGEECGINTRLQSIGCAGRITSFTETEDGRYMVTLTGVSRFRVGKVEQGFTPYLCAGMDWASFHADLGAAEHDQQMDRTGFLDLLTRYFDLEELQTDWDSLQSAEDELLVNALSMLCPFDPADKQALLEAPSLTTRRETLVTLMEFALRKGQGEEKIQ
ncbi:LON peptidase substrate-binding domain-containing protein [Aliiroseovarius marinus]|uniref:LON peptidase substrate-binding domain-containing protein n=1 Tax=Aliiroseovarius marinus TaxID=2500159 RepID=UPI003D7D0800